MEERLMKKSQADEECIFLTSILLSIKKPDDIQRLELRIEFLSSVTRRIQICKNLSLPFSSVPTALTFRALQLDLRAQQVSIQHTLGIQTLERIHRACSVSQAQNYCRLSFRFDSESF